MEDMDLDQVVYVPDTPDRLDARHMMGRESVGKVCNSPLACDLSNPDRVDTNYVNEPSVRGRLFTENGNIRRLVIRPPRNLDNLDIKSCSNSNGDSSSASGNAHDFQRVAVGKSREAKRNENMDKGKAMSIKSSSKSSAYHEKTNVFDSSKQNGHGKSPRNFFRHGELEDLDAQDTRKEMSFGSSSLHCIPGHSERSRNAVKGKEKLDDSTFKGLGLAVTLGKGVHLSPNPQGTLVQQNPHHSFTFPRAGGQKRLVRNGCISPHNIATRNKQLAEQRNNASEVTDQSQAGKVDSNGSPYVIDISDLVNENNNSQMLKGKGKGKGRDLLIHSSSPEENNARTIHASSRSLLNDKKEDNRTSDLHTNISGRSEELGDWRSTRNCSSQVDYIFPGSTDYLPSRVNGVGNFVSQHHNRVERRDTRRRGTQMPGDDFSENLNATQTASGLVSELDQIAGLSHAAKTVIKRQKKRGLSLRNHAECSTSVPDGSDIVFLGSSGPSESSTSSRGQRHQFHRTSSQVIEVDELSPAAGQSVPRGVDFMHEDSDVKARQLEADEMLARELQEQLYHEVPITGGGEIDEHLAWALQQEENASNTSRGSHNTIGLRGSTILHSNRQPRPESFQNHPNRRATQARVPTSSRMAQLRTRLHNQSGRVSTRARNLRFPSDMDLDMRMNILEALEAAFDVGPDNHLLRVQRDFNDNDYEMLLALDENNHQHAGATGQQINNLPQSTVQTVSEEACTICLETPTIGETVRHLPCLHRFHKDCIDPWLSRRTSCPVCKCSIT